MLNWTGGKNVGKMDNRTFIRFFESNFRYEIVGKRNKILFSKIFGVLRLRNVWISGFPETRVSTWS